MCGIFGRVNYEKPLSERDVESCRVASLALRHRGPDAGGEWYVAQTYMGQRRLAIIDLSDAANQPFQDQTGRYTLTYNGEIYNYLELRHELEAEGVRFRTESDTEVLIAAWIRWGEAALQRFDGMFAIAIHDREKNRHTLIRDPLGQKPLYYAANKEGVIYASELRSLLALPELPWKLDKAAFARFLMAGYYGWNETPVAGIHKLLPGCLLTIENGQATERRYWDSLPGDSAARMDTDEAVAEFIHLLDRSCEIAMRSDVPYGVFLSGGIDSSLILNACRKADREVRAFSVAMSEVDFDESAKARLVIKTLGGGAHDLFTLDAEDISQSIDDVFTNSDEPHADPGFVNTLFLARACRPHVTVALAGDGGDELFAGYAPFQGLGPVPWLNAVPAPLINLFKSAAAFTRQSDGYMSFLFKLKAYLQGFPAPDDLRYALWLATDELSTLAKVCPALPQDFFVRSGGAGTIFETTTEAMRPVRGRSQQQMLLYYYQKLFLPEFVCMHTDRAAMQVSMEVRAPFLSLPLIKFANTLPDDLKLRGGTLKWLLRKAAERVDLPTEICSQEKQGFTFPLARWLKSTLREKMIDLLAEHALPGGLVDSATVRHLSDAHLSGQQNNYRLLYGLMAFQAWRKQFPQVDIS